MKFYISSHRHVHSVPSDVDFSQYHSIHQAISHSVWLSADDDWRFVKRDTGRGTIHWHGAGIVLIIPNGWYVR